ncbi:helix-turn-helix transcriptional regulator [Clostridium saccharoperbutylacetonicum]|nr:helix-turn-helix transcriptional regulator [Clostridium saccharoperbutylacetonicum]
MDGKIKTLRRHKLIMFNERLEKYRDELHLKQNEMAYKLKVSDGYYSLIESGKRYPSKK